MAAGQPTFALNNLVTVDEDSIIRVPVAGGVSIFEGAIVSYDGSDAAIQADDSGPVIGRAMQTVKNTTALGGGVDGDKFIDVARRCQMVVEGTATLAATVITGFNDVAYPVDGQSVTDVPGTHVAGRVFMAENVPSVAGRLGYSNPVVLDFDLAS